MTRSETSQPSTNVGLSLEQAAIRLREVGPNEPLTAVHHKPIVDFLILFGNPLAIVLLIAAGVSAVTGELFDAGLIALLVVLGTSVDFLQTFHSRRTIEKLRSTVAPTATVCRDCNWIELARVELVPGDVLRFSAGDLVPADARLLTAKDVYVQQAMLTGESSPAEKQATAEGPSKSANAVNMVFVGTSVISGTATAEVVATGRSTAFADIVARLSEKAPETAFDAGLRRFSYLITKIVFGLVLFVLVVSIALHRPALESLLFAVSLAVGMTPEFLPMITSVTLARGAIRMADKHVVVKRLPAIQNLGSIDVLCTDKTGTLTSGEIQLRASLGPDGLLSELPLRYGRVNAELQTGIRSPLDVALLSQQSTDAGFGRKIDELPFDFQRRRLSVLVEAANGPLLICKGSPEGMLPLVEKIRTTAGDVEVTESHLAQVRGVFETESEKGNRLLAVGIRSLAGRKSISQEDESELTLVGFLSFSDPLLPEIADTIADLKANGIQIKILSGDSDLVTRFVCEQAGMPITGVVLGDNLDDMSDGALIGNAERANVFARLSPAQKVRVLAALRRRGHVVGFIGDGVNDAPAMHAADVGIAAPHAVDIAQDAADVVLLQPGLEVLHEGILEGRRAFGNVMKYLLMGTSSNFGNVLSMAFAASILPFLPMLPVQVLLNNFLYDLSQLSIPTDTVDDGYMRKPQHWNLKTVTRFMVVTGPISSLFDFLTFWILLAWIHAGPVEFHSGWFIESLATQTLVLLVIRTSGLPWKSRPSKFLVLTVITAIAVGVWLPYSSWAGRLGFAPLPLRFLEFVTVATIIYLMLVEIAKRAVMAAPYRPSSAATAL